MLNTEEKIANFSDSQKADVGSQKVQVFLYLLFLLEEGTTPQQQQPRSQYRILPFEEEHKSCYLYPRL